MASGELDIDLVVHDGGALGRWAGSVRRGAAVVVDGPRDVPELPAGPVDWTLLVADHPAQPALAARVAALRPATGRSPSPSCRTRRRSGCWRRPRTSRPCSCTPVTSWRRCCGW
ncbi:siderophore-interacting protein [Pseudonocardia sp. NPDC049635]|uniref:siderophore-interacting protein n=1 Tax=Pseudonocardia sp. NPDC049635 TaxID=3155506 RepID=UPI0033F57AC2